jgi:hypothetical protein
MKKLTILFILVSTFTYSQEAINIIAVPTQDKDTLFVLDNSLGDLIIQSWNDYKNKPIFVRKPIDELVLIYRKENE